jgi:hypothetical protein
MHFLAVTPREVPYAEGVSSFSPASLPGKVLVARKERGERCCLRLPWEVVLRIPYAKSVESSEAHDTLELPDLGVTIFWARRLSDPISYDVKTRFICFPIADSRNATIALQAFSIETNLSLRRRAR